MRVWVLASHLTEGIIADLGNTGISILFINGISTHAAKQQSHFPKKIRENAVGSKECIYLLDSDNKENFHKWTDEGSDNDFSVKWCISWRICFEREAA